MPKTKTQKIEMPTQKIIEKIGKQAKIKMESANAEK